LPYSKRIIEYILIVLVTKIHAVAVETRLVQDRQALKLRVPFMTVFKYLCNHGDLERAKHIKHLYSSRNIFLKWSWLACSSTCGAG